MAETLIIILAEHNVPINFADHFTKLVSNKLVFPDSVFLRVRAARAPCSLKVVIARVVTNFFFQKLSRSAIPIRFFKSHSIFKPSYNTFYEEININHALLCFYHKLLTFK